MANLLPLTVCLITNQFTAQTDQLFKSVLPLATQVLVINTPGAKLSTKEKKIEIIPYLENEMNFSKWRNFAIKKATQEWLLFVDHDEIISNQLLAQLSHLINQDQINGYFIRRTDYFLGKQLKHGEVGNVHILRLARTNNFSFQGTVHEKGKVTGLTKTIDQSLHHYPHQSVASFINKIAVYSYLSASSKSNSFSLLKLLIYPPAKFIFNFVIKLGFLDGFRGLIYAIMMSFHSLSVRVFEYEISQNH